MAWAAVISDTTAPHTGSVVPGTLFGRLLILLLIWPVHSSGY